MGFFRFKKNIKILPGFKLNLNKNSTSVTIGKRGLHYTMNSKGKKTTSIGIPGTGLSYINIDNNSQKTDRYSNNINHPVYEGAKNSNNNFKKPFYKRIWFIALLLFFLAPVGIFIMWYCTEWKKPIKVIISIIGIMYFSIYCCLFV